jgi:hypothetical protein
VTLIGPNMMPDFDDWILFESKLSECGSWTAWRVN